MSTPDIDAVMRGFLYQKALIARYGVQGAADLNVLATRLVEQGDFTTKRAAIAAIEEQAGGPVTTPLSEEAATHATRQRRAGLDEER